MKPTKIPVLITAVGGGGIGEQILKSLVLANKTDNRYHIIAGDMNPDCPQFALAHESFQLPAANDDDFIDALMTICKKRDCQALFYGCEPDMKTISQHRDIFKSQNICVPLNPQSVIDTCMDKIKTGALLFDLGFHPPRWIETNTPDDLASIDWFPVIVKPATGSGGSSHCYIAQSADELQSLYRYLTLAVSGQKMVVQEYVGTPQSEFTVGVLMDLNGRYINAIAMNRFMSGQLNIRAKYPNNTSNQSLGDHLVISSGVSHGKIGRFPDITEKCKAIAERLGATGAINIQLRLVDGDIKVFEINPRFSGTTYLRAMMGYNEPDALLRKHVLGEAITVDFPYKEDTILRSLTENIAPSISTAHWTTITQS